MKVTLDLSELLAKGKISQEEYDRLLAFSRRGTRHHAYWILAIFACIAIFLGVIGLFPDFFSALDQMLLDVFGPQGIHLLVIVLAAVGAALADSGFLAGLCAFLILTFLGNSGLFYTHASYFMAIEDPTLTTVVFAGLAYIGYLASKELEQKYRRVSIIFSRTCVFIVNLAFWVGSLWGGMFLDLLIPDYVFCVAWACALVVVGVWAAARDKRWIVNAAAVFGSIHFYTQWFERLGASPGTLLWAGGIALAILYGLKQYNYEALKHFFDIEKTV